VTSIREAVVAALPAAGRLVLAVSGGLDSMVMLDAVAHSVDSARLIVATFDHGTGPAASAATAFVGARTASLGIPCRLERAAGPLSSEASLREARWRFLAGVAAASDARVCTAHNRDDQVETVLMRILRGAGARGLAGLEAATDVVRPLLSHSRRDIAAYARARGLAWVEDPSNTARRYLRNRVRHELLPAMRRVHPSIDAELLAAGREAGAWRRRVEAFVEREIAVSVHGDRAALDVPADALCGRTANELRVLWPAIVARVGVALDRRGTDRLAAFVGSGRVGSRMPLSGGWEMVRGRARFELRRSHAPLHRRQPLSSGAVLGLWSFRSVDATTGDLWSASLPTRAALTVRSWQAGDTMVNAAAGRRRTVKHYLTRAGVTGAERRGWPVVLADEEIVWIPGVRRSDIATAGAGQPGLPFVCEYLSR